MATFGLNRYSFIGRIGSAKTVTEVNHPFIALSVAIDSSYNTKEGEKVDRTDWVNVTVNGTDQADYLQVGRAVLVEGRPSVEPYIDKDGKAQASISLKGAVVTYLDKKPE